SHDGEAASVGSERSRGSSADPDHDRTRQRGGAVGCARGATPRGRRAVDGGVGMTMAARRGPVPHGSRVGAPWPPREDFMALARRGDLIPVSREILADLETPVSAFLKIHRGPYGFLLESVQGGERWGRFTFLGTEPAEVLRVRGHDVEVEAADGS